MGPEQLDEQLLATLEDGVMSRAERRSLRDVLTAAGPDQAARARWRARAFDIAREALDEHGGVPVLEWIENVVKSIEWAGRAEVTASQVAGRSEAVFSPGDACRMTIGNLLRDAEQSADICVFTITDDRISEAIIGAKRRGVTVRLISDNDKAHDLGSDVERLGKVGVAVRVDRTDAHMHHKVAVFDRKVLLTGSYNWTRSAASENQENLIVTEAPGLVRSFAAEFDKLWAAFG